MYCWLWSYQQYYGQYRSSGGQNFAMVMCKDVYITLQCRCRCQLLSQNYSIHGHTVANDTVTKLQQLLITAVCSDHIMSVLSEVNVTYREAGSSVENSSTELSARRIAFIPRMHTQFPQNRQFSFITYFLRKLGWSSFRGIASGRELQNAVQ